MITRRSATKSKKVKRRLLIARDVIFTDDNLRSKRKRNSHSQAIVVVAFTMDEITRLATAYCKDHWPAMHIGEIREPEVPVIMAYSLVSRVER
jgi:hypothetical protein